MSSMPEEPVAEVDENGWASLDERGEFVWLPSVKKSDYDALRQYWSEKCAGLEADLAQARLEAEAGKHAYILLNERLERTAQEAWPEEITPEMEHAADVAMITPITPHGGFIRGRTAQIVYAALRAAHLKAKE